MNATLGQGRGVRRICERRWARWMFTLISFVVPTSAALTVTTAMAAAAYPDEGVTVVNVTDDVLVAQPKRLGINVGAPEPYGAAQLMKNIVPNPGFEAGVFSMIFHAGEGADARRVPQAFWDTEWNNDEYGVGQPAGFWDGAEYEIVYGPAKGRTGRVERFVQEGNESVFYLDGDGAAPVLHDVILVRRGDVPAAPETASAHPDKTTTRPGSPGKQSLRLSYPGEMWQAAYVQYFDSYGRDADPTAGKLLRVEGTWRLEFWAKGGNGGAEMRAEFLREGIEPFINSTFTLSGEWAHYEVELNVPAGVDAPKKQGEEQAILALGFYLPRGGEAWIDDVSLSKASDNTTAFTDTLLKRYGELRPGILRFWAEQAGNDLDNQLAEPWKRGPHGFRPQERFATGWCYSLPEFLALCEATGAEPWYVIPPAFSPADLRNLIAYLAAAPISEPYALRRVSHNHTKPWTDVFKTIHLEFGNEMWGSAAGGDPFMGASALGGERLGALAQDRLAILKSSPFYDAQQFDLIVGGQYGSPGVQETLGATCANATSIALAPYFGQFDQLLPEAQLYASLFARPFCEVSGGAMRQCRECMQKSGRVTPFSIYEINFHTTEGPAPETLRNDIVAGMAGGVALPLSMLVYLRELGIVNQCAFTTAQYSFGIGDGQHVRLWGLLRDLESTARKRPTWLGVELVNRAIAGDMVATLQSGANPRWTQPCGNGIDAAATVSYIQPFAFQNGVKRSLVLFNCSLANALPVRLQLPVQPENSAVHQWLASDDIRDNNENSERIRIRTEVLAGFRNPFTMTLPPHSVHVIQWQAANAGKIGEQPRRIKWTGGRPRLQPAQ